MNGPTLLDRLNFRQAARARRVKARDTDIVLSNEILAVSRSEESSPLPTRKFPISRKLIPSKTKAT